ncbi:MAG: ATP-dependent helicase HrpB [Puniceicoccaceae bacterium MED-G30]|nr:MAG: ATP-dependent helicase HrpB [Puniceicoccaceae bacterium MED-G30]
MSAAPPVLPIHAVAGEILRGLAESGRVVLSAPTGSGKSTQVPQILLDQAEIAGEIIVLQPRRLAARMLARRVASERSVSLGEEVGYQVRFDNRTGRQTRIRFVTEAILLRRILDDPALPGVGALIFDEFHERSLSSDLGIAAAFRAVQNQRPDLKLVVMSATLDVESLSGYLQPSAQVEAAGRMYPVEVAYAGASLGRQAAPVWERAARAFRDAVRNGETGHVLVFMPGAYEIRRTIAALESLPEVSGRQVLPLYGELSPEAQDRAVDPSDQPKVIVATNVAETSITIDGVRLVLDGGLARIARFDPRRGINSILVEPISRDAAEQRRGRAGRTGPGRCIRLWSEAEQAARPQRDTAEVRRVDLSESLLLLAAHGVEDFHAFPWFEEPDAASLEKAQALLQDLGAFDATGSVTKRGRDMARLPLHPRFARMLLEGVERGVLDEVAKIAAIAQGRGLYRPAQEAAIRKTQIRELEDPADPRSDFFVQLRALQYAHANHFKRADCVERGIHAGAARQAWEASRQIAKMAERMGPVDTTPVDPKSAVCHALLAAFSDQLCLRNDPGTRRCRLVHQRSGELRRESLVEAPLFVAAEVEERIVRGEATLLIGMATAVEMDWLEKDYPGEFISDTSTRYDASARRVVALAERTFRGLALSKPVPGEPDAGAAAEKLAAEVLSGNLVLKQWNAAVEKWIQRVNFVARHCPETEIAPIDDAARSFLIEQICHGSTSYKEIKDRPVLPVVQQWLDPAQLYYIDAYAPAERELPRRKRPASIRYESDGRAFIASKLQDFYDLPGDQLRIANGRVALLVELLAPNGRPAHLTDDLDSFWTGAYVHVRKELAGRYPKHEWRPVDG